VSSRFYNIRVENSRKAELEDDASQTCLEDFSSKGLVTPRDYGFFFFESPVTDNIYNFRVILKTPH
jgi:hypothetical protein